MPTNSMFARQFADTADILFAIGRVGEENVESLCFNKVYMPV